MTSGLPCTSAGGPSAMTPAEVERDDLVGDAHDQVHVVLDQQHGDAAAGRGCAGSRRQLVDLLVVEAAGRLVEQQELRACSRARARARRACGCRTAARPPADRRRPRGRAPRSARRPRVGDRALLAPRQRRRSALARKPPRAERVRADASRSRRTSWSRTARGSGRCGRCRARRSRAWRHWRAARPSNTIARAHGS